MRQKTKTEPTRAALYVRVSTNRQEDNNSIPGQIAVTTDYAERRGWKVAGVWKDSAVSGAKPWAKRPGASDLLDKCQAGDVDVIVMKSLDRFSRSVVGGLTDLETLQGLGVAIVFLNVGGETLDTSTPTGELMFNVLLTIAQFERRLINERTSGGTQTAIKDATDPETGRVSRWVAGGLPPYGWASVEGELVVNEDEAAVVKRIFAMTAEGMNQGEIEEAFEREGTKSRGVKGVPGRFHRKLVGSILRNRALLGEGIEKDGLTYDAPAIIDRELWQSAHRGPAPRALQRTAQDDRQSHFYALSEVVFHEHGDGTVSSMFGQAVKRKTGWTRLYRCKCSQTRSGREATCDGFGISNGHNATSIQADIAEARVIQAALLDRTPEDWAALAQERLQAYTEGDDEVSLKRDRKKLATAEAQYRGHLSLQAEAVGNGDDAAAQHHRQLAEEQRAIVDTLTERVQSVEARKVEAEELALTIQALLSAEVYDDPEGDDGGLDNVPALGSQTWRREVAGYVKAILDHAESDDKTVAPRLPGWVVESAADAFRKLGLVVTLKATGDPRVPEVSVAPSHRGTHGSPPDASTLPNR